MRVIALASLIFSNCAWAQPDFVFSETAKCNKEFEPYFKSRAIAAGGLVGRNLLQCYAGEEYSHPLIISIYTQDTEMVQIILEHGANPNLKNGGGRTPLQESKRTGNKELTDLLLRYGAK